MTGKFHMLRITLESLPGSVATTPWVARLGGPCPKYGVQREFVESLRDWSKARRKIGGRLQGAVACFALIGGHTYEIARLRGRSRKRCMVREFAQIDAKGDWHDLSADEALAAVDPCPGAVAMSVPDRTRVSLITGIGTPAPLGFLLVGGERRYQLRPDALHEISSQEDGTRLVLVQGDKANPITSTEALSWLASRR